MAVRVGIPRALFFYYYYPQWEAFFKELGAEVVLSSPTNKAILESGIQTAVDEACLPVKVFYGHVLELAHRVDYLFLPRLVSVEARTYICPKFMGLPDMIKSNLPGLPPVIDLCVDVSKKDCYYQQELYRIGKIFTKSISRIKKAEKEGALRLKQYQKLQNEGWLPLEALEIMKSQKIINFSENINSIFSLTIGLMGHGYTIYDDFVSQQLISKLRRLGANIITQDMLDDKIVEEYAQKLPKKMFWTMGKKILGSNLYFLENHKVDGIVYLTCFGCGPDSFVTELVKIEAGRKKNIPLMVLTVDEHTGEAGIITRLEAFIDMIRRRQKHKAG